MLFSGGKMAESTDKKTNETQPQPEAEIKEESTMSKHADNAFEQIQRTIRASIDTTPEAVSIYFKTRPGEYAEHDHFLGIKTPTLRKIAKDHITLPLKILEQFLQSQFNEERLFALIVLVLQYQKGDTSTKENIYQSYLHNTQYVNNWNLVDNSAHHIVGSYLFHKNRSILLNLAKSPDLWERRIAIVATWHFIKKQDFDYTTKITAMLMQDPHDLIHKACGWMLREMGKQNEDVLTVFLNQHCTIMPRTMLRYAIERFPKDIRKHYLLNK